MKHRRQPDLYRDGSQLCLFVEPQFPKNETIDKLVSDLSMIETMIGTDEDWLIKTLSDVLTLWDELYDKFVRPFEEQISEAKRELGNSSNKGLVKKDLELLRLKMALSQSLITNPYIERMERFEARVYDRAKELGADESNLEYVSDLIHSFFHQPQYDELKFSLSEAVEVLAKDVID
jgi:hypothetical protein